MLELFFVILFIYFRMRRIFRGMRRLFYFLLVGYRCNDFFFGGCEGDFIFLGEVVVVVGLELLYGVYLYY